MSERAIAVGVRRRGRRSRARPALTAAACAMLGAGLALGASPARATWSIVAVDPATREVGVAGASCIGGVEVIGGVVPGKGAVVAQALGHPPGRDAAKDLLAAGIAPAEIVARITRSRFDGGLVGWRWRQYGVVSLDQAEAPAVFTGPWVFDWSGARTGPGVAVQGNVLRGAEVLDATYDAFAAAAGPCVDLAERLLRAIEAGAAAGGDRRCERDIGALSAFLVVARPDDPPAAPSLALVAPHAEEPDTSPVTFLARLVVAHSGDAADAPVRRLRAAFDAHRVAAPLPGCPLEAAPSHAAR